MIQRRSSALPCSASVRWRTLRAPPSTRDDYRH
jgi:hypothetical protein